MKRMLNLPKLVLMATVATAIGALMYACQDTTVDDAAMPSGVVASKTVVTIGGDETCDVTYIDSSTDDWANNCYLLKGDVRVPDGVTLTIAAGTVIFGDRATQGTLTIERGGKILALGTAAAPIVFTSSAPPGQRQPNDWGGINIMGKAPNNKSVNQNPEGYPTCVTAPQYGGTEPADNSGILRYVRIEYAGIPFAENLEKNALTMYSVGSGTEIHHIQVSYGGDDGYEWFGGTVNAHHLVSLAMTDDDFDTDFGFSGNVQFGLSIRHPQHADISESNGFESDNDNVGGGSGATPQTSAVFSNFTLVGPYDPKCERTVLDNASPGKRFRSGLHLRRNTAIDVHNTLVVGWRREQVFIGPNVGAGLVLADNRTVVPNVVGATCVTEPVLAQWTTGTDNICVTATECVGAEEDCSEVLDGLAVLSGLSCAAWPAVVFNETCGYFEFADFDAYAFVPTFGASLLSEGSDATLLAGSFGANETSSGAGTYYIGAFGGDNFESEWGLTGNWLEMNPQEVPYDCDAVEDPSTCGDN